MDSRRPHCSCECCQTGIMSATYRFAGNLPLGVRFNPSGPVLVNYYLKNMVVTDDIGMADIYTFSSPDHIRVQYNQMTQKNNENMYILSPRHKLTRNGKRPDRSTLGGGCWSMTSVTTEIKDDSGNVTGTKNTFVWYPDKTKRKEKQTKNNVWIMDEYALKQNDSAANSTDPDNRMIDVVLCKIHMTGRDAKDYKKQLEAVVEQQQQQPEGEQEQEYDLVDDATNKSEEYLVDNLSNGVDEYIEWGQVEEHNNNVLSAEEFAEICASLE